MKTLLVKIVPSLLCLFMASTSLAQSQCHVVLTGPCAPQMQILPNQLFRDMDPMANASARRCAQRAIEYYQYCQMSGPSGAYTYFHNGISWIGATGNHGDPKVNYSYQLNQFGQWEYIGVINPR